MAMELGEGELAALLEDRLEAATCIWCREDTLVQCLGYTAPREAGEASSEAAFLRCSAPGVPLKP